MSVGCTPLLPHMHKRNIPQISRNQNQQLLGEVQQALYAAYVTLVLLCDYEGAVSVWISSMRSAQVIFDWTLCCWNVATIQLNSALDCIREGSKANNGWRQFSAAFGNREVLPGSWIIYTTNFFFLCYVSLRNKGLENLLHEFFLAFKASRRMVFKKNSLQSPTLIKPLALKHIRIYMIALDRKCLTLNIVTRYIWVDIFEACQTGRIYLKHVRLVGYIWAMSHSQNISCKCHRVSGVLVWKKKNL